MANAINTKLLPVLWAPRTTHSPSPSLSIAGVLYPDMPYEAGLGADVSVLGSMSHEI